MQVTDIDAGVERRQHVFLRECAGVQRDRRQGFVLIGTVGRDPVFLRGPCADHAAGVAAGVDQRHRGWPGEAGLVEHRRHAATGVLAQRHQRRECCFAVDQLLDAALLGLLCLVRDAAPAEHRQQLVDCRRRKPRAYLSWGNGARRTGQVSELLARAAHPLRKFCSVPVRSGPRRLHRLVGAVIQRPVEQERIDRVPVACAERTGKAAVDRTAGEDADQVGAIGRGDHCIDGFFGRRQGTSRLARRLRGVLGVQQVGVFGQRCQFGAHALDRGADVRAVGRRVAAERQRDVVAPRAIDQRQREHCLPHRQRLPDARLVEAHEVGRLAGEVGEQHFAAAQRRHRMGGQVIEQLLHRIVLVVSGVRPGSALGAEHVDAGEAAGRAGMANAYRLVRLALAAIGRAHHFHRVGASHL